jgi:hypothetical protein
MNKPQMHCHQELEQDLGYVSFLPDNILLKWFNDNYSSSKHLLTLYSLATGLNAQTMLEIGFGRSSFVLARAAAENKAKLFCCDTRDFSYLLNEDEKKVVDFTLGRSDLVWPKLSGSGIDFAFLDYFSDEKIEGDFVIHEIKKCLSLMKTNGIIAVHDTCVNKYAVSEIFQKNPFNTMFRKNVELISLPYNYGLGILRKLGKSRYGKSEDKYNVKKSEAN